MTQFIKNKNMVVVNKKLTVSKSPALPETGPINEKSVKVAAAAAETTKQVPVIKPPPKTAVAKPPKKPSSGDKLATFGKDLGGAIIGQAVAKNNANRLF